MEPTRRGFESRMRCSTFPTPERQPRLHELEHSGLFGLSLTLQVTPITAVIQITSIIFLLADTCF
jgi:hypothetical protein